MSDSRTSRKTLRTLILVGLLVALGFAPAAFAAGQSTITAYPPRVAGTVTLQIFFCADPQCSHGTTCNVTANIPAGIDGKQKAALIESAILNQCSGTGTQRVNNSVTVSNNASNNGLKITKATDNTGEIMLVDNDGVGLPVNYTHKMTLNGSTTSGRVTYGINGNVHEVETAGKTVMDIYFELQALMGEGSVDPDGLTTGPGYGEYRSIYFQVTDPGLEIEVEEFD